MKKVSRKKLEKMVLEIIENFDYDIYKELVDRLNDEMDEDFAFAHQDLAELVDIAEKHVNGKISHKVINEE